MILSSVSSRSSIAIAFFYLCILSCVQLLLAYGALDAARLLHTQAAFDAYRPPLDNAFFYPDNLVKEGNTTTMGNLLTSVACIFMLALVFKTDNEAVLLTVCPLEELLLGDVVSSGGGRLWPHRVGLACRCVVLQMFWAIRLFMAPLCLGVPTLLPRTRAGRPLTRSYVC